MGLRPQYSMIIWEEVGLHHASPPLSYSGYWPLWISCEYRGTTSSQPVATPGLVAGTSKRSGMSEPIRPRRHTVGVKVVPGFR